MPNLIRVRDLYWLLVILLVMVDQLTKIYIKTHFYLGQEVFLIGDWFRLAFVENSGIAYGLEVGGELGKYFLSIFRILFSIVLIIFMSKQLKKNNESPLFYLSLSLILAGAIGNVIDGTIYGCIFSASPYHIPIVAHFVPWGEGYSGLFQGKVVDMFYFPIYAGILPKWIPLIGDKPFSFFNFIFNVADACISVGLVLFLIHLQLKEIRQKRAK